MSAAPARGVRLVVASTGALLLVACLPDKDKEPEWHKPPKAYDPRGADLTFNRQRLEQFNALDEDGRAEQVEAMKASAGAFRGQAVFRRGTELGDAMDDLQYGRYEIYAVAPGPDMPVADGVLYEINLEYYLFTEQEVFLGWPPGSHIEFTGTLADLTYQSDAKPRKMELKVKADSVNQLKD